MGALKGDFTRTRKRDFQGAIKDMGLSISRFYSGIVNDYFSQVVIDFLLGTVSSVVFEDFEANMMSSDPGMSMQKMRQAAIETSQNLPLCLLSGPDELFYTMCELFQEPCALSGIRQRNNIAALDDPLPFCAHLHDLAMEGHPLNLRANALHLFHFA